MTTTTLAPAIPSVLERAQRATGAYLDALVPLRPVLAEPSSAPCEHCGAFDVVVDGPRPARHVQRDLLAVHRRREALLTEGDADVRVLGDLAATIHDLLCELDAATRGTEVA